MATATTTAPTATEPVKILEGFLEASKCQYLIDTYKDRVKRSTVVSPSGDVEDSARTSHTFFLPDDDSVIMEMREKTARLAGVPADHVEGLQLVRYSKGEQYKFHYDYFDAINENQREHTFLVYLNDLAMEDGGATIFKGYNVKVYPRQGRAIWFRDLTEDGKLNEKSLHAGEEVQTDTIKYAVNIWIRQKKVMDLPSVARTGPPASDAVKSVMSGSWDPTIFTTILVLGLFVIAVWFFRDTKPIASAIRFLRAVPARVRSAASGVMKA